MNCPKCTALDIGDYLASTDQLWCEFESEVQEHTLFTVYWCRRCDFSETKEFDPQLIHDGKPSEIISSNDE